MEFYNRLSQIPVSPSPHRHPQQHPHQLAFHVEPAHRLTLETLHGTTSDEIWPQLEKVVTSGFPGLKPRVESADVRRRHSLSDAIAATSLGVGMSPK